MTIGMGNLFVLPLLIGGTGDGKRSFVIDPFICIRPVSNKHLLCIYLMVAFVTLGMTWITFLGGVWAICGWLTLNGQGVVAAKLIDCHEIIYSGADTAQQQASQAIWFAICYIWAVMGLIASLVLTGRRWFIGAVWFSLCFGIGGYAFLHNASLLPESIVAIVDTCIRSAWTFACIGGTVSAFAFARYKRRISTSLVLTAGIAYVVLYMAVGLGWFTNFDLESTEIIHMAGPLALPIAPLALAPLALHWNRHR